MALYGVPSCPMATRRAPELATGAMEEFYTELGRSATAALALAAVQLDASDRSLVKLSMWRQLPHALCGIASPMPSVARDSASRSLALYDSAPDAAEHHPLSLL
eukprot:13627235-Alexandrium_andersonii.AAC.1